MKNKPAYTKPIALWVVGFFAILTSCSPIQDQGGLLPDTPLDLSEEGRDVRILQTEYGKPVWQIEAPKTKTVAVEQEQETLFPEGFTILVYNEEGMVESNLTAQYGSITDGGAYVEALQNVQIVNANGECLQTEKLIWNKAEKKLFSDAFVTITKAEEILWGHGFEANEDFSEYTILDLSGIVSIEQ